MGNAPAPLFCQRHAIARNITNCKYKTNYLV